MIRFLAKIAGQKAVSTLPLGLRAYSALQSHVTGSIRPTPAKVRQKAEVGLLYHRAIRDLGDIQLLSEDLHVELGAGWHLTIPLLFHQLGCDAQLLTDVRRLARAETVFEVARHLEACDLPISDRRRIPVPETGRLEPWLEEMGIRYLAPIRRRFPLADSTAGLVTSTQTLLHPPREEVIGWFLEAARVLRVGGLFLGTIHLYDLYSEFDPALPRFNFLRYSRASWERWFNSDVMAYNRLRSSDYEGILRDLPFRIEVWDLSAGTDPDVEETRRVGVSEEFASYDERDLFAAGLFFVARRVG